MTYNSIIKRVREISLAHRQVRDFYTGRVRTFLDDKKAKYPAVLLQDLGGLVSLTGAATQFNFKLILADLVHQSMNHLENEQDVHSDLVSIALDLLAQMNRYTDWRVSAENSLEFGVDQAGDLYAMAAIDFNIQIRYTQNVCEVPSTLINYSATTARRVKITAQKLVTGELTLLFTEIDAANIPTDQDILITDYTQGLEVVAETGEHIRLAFYKDPDTGEISFKLDEV